MKRYIAVLLTLVMMLSVCTPAYGETSSTTIENLELHILEDNPGEIVEGNSKSEPPENSFTGLNDPDLLDYVEQNIYSMLSAQLGPEYKVDSVSAKYVSKEYLEELSYNSQTNVFFGYSLADLDAQFQGTRYVFTLDENNETTVIPFEKYDDTYEKVIKMLLSGRVLF